MKRGRSVPAEIGKRQGEDRIRLLTLREVLTIRQIRRSEGVLDAGIMKTCKNMKGSGSDDGVSSSASDIRNSSAQRTKSQNGKPPPSPLAKEMGGQTSTFRTIETPNNYEGEKLVVKCGMVIAADITDIPQLTPEETLSVAPFERRLLQGSKVLLKSWEQLAEELKIPRIKVERVAEEARQIVDIRLSVYAVIVCKVVIRALLRLDPAGEMMREERFIRELKRAIRLGDIRQDDVMMAELRVNSVRGRSTQLCNMLDSESPKGDQVRGEERPHIVTLQKRGKPRGEAPSRARTQLGLLYSSESDGPQSGDSKESSIGSARGFGMFGERNKKRIGDESDSEKSERSELSPRREKQRQDKEYLQALRTTQPSKFKGELSKPQALVEWVTQMSQYFSLMNLGKKEEVNIAVSHLEKGVSVWWCQVPRKKKEQLKSWKLFRNYIIREFLPHDYNLQFWRQLDDTKQRTSVAEYIERFQEVQRQILDIPENIAMTKFLNGLKPTLRGHVLALRPRTQRESMRLARNFDNAYFVRTIGAFKEGKTNERSWNTGMYNRNRFGRVNNSETGEVNAVDKFKDKRKQEGKSFPSKDSRKTFKCFNCDKVGHMARDCWLPKKQFGKAVVNTVKPEEDHIKDKPQRSSDPTDRRENEQLQELGIIAVARAVNPPRSAELTVYWGHVQGHRAEILVDSGASTIFISEAFIRKNRIKTCKRPVPIRIDFAGLAEQVSIRMVPNVELALGTYKEFLTFELAAAIYEVILGKAWLDDHHAEIITNSHELYFQHKGQRHVIGKESLVGRSMVQNMERNEERSCVGEEALQLVGSKPFQKLLKLSEGQIFSVKIIDKEQKEKEEIQVPNEHRKKITELLDQFSNTFHEAIPIGPDEQIHGVTHDIVLEAGNAPTVSPMYRLSASELQELREKVDDLLKRGYIRPSSSPYAAGVLFVPKKGGKLRMCIDYRQLNKVTTKNRYPLPLIDELLEKLQTARIFSKMDLTDGYHHIPITEQDRAKTAFRTPMGLYEYTVMPFGLANAPATFQRFMNEIFRDMTEECLLVYMDDLLVHSKSEQEHTQHLTKVLKRLEEKKMCVKLSKSQFFQKSVEFLGYIIGQGTVAPDPEKVRAIIEWPSPLPSVTAVRSFLGLAQFYKRFIPQFSEVAAPLTNLTKSEKVFDWGESEQRAFDQLKTKLAELPKVYLPKTDDPFKLRVQTDASGFAVGAVLHQINDEGKEVPVAYASRKLEERELGRPVHEKEFIAIHFALTKWRHLLLGREFSVYTDHQSLQFFMTQKKLDARFARMAGFLSQFDLKINYKPGKENQVPDALSRRHDYEERRQLCNIQMLKREDLASVWQDKIRQVGYEKEYEQLMETCGQAHKIRQGKYWFLQENGILWVAKENEWRMVIPSGLVQEVIEKAHKGTVGACKGFLKTFADIRNAFFWKGMFSDVTQYIRKCSTCAQIKDSTTAKRAPLCPIPPAEERWQQISMDFISDLPQTKNGHDTILTVVDSLTKQAHFLPCKKTDSAREVALLFRKEVWKHHGLPLVTISDRDTRFVCDFWKSLQELLGVQTRLSSAFHPETDGQSERANRTVEQILRFYCLTQQDRWDEYIEVAEFAYNSSMHSSTGVAPFIAAYGYKPTMDLPDLQNSRSRTVSEQVKYMKEAKEGLHQSILRVQQYQKKQADKQGRVERKFEIGDWVWLNTVHLNMRTLQKKLAPRYVGPMKIVGKISEVAFRLETPRRWRIHDVFYIGVLRRYEGDKPEEEAKNIPVLTAGYGRKEEG